MSSGTGGNRDRLSAVHNRIVYGIDIKRGRCLTGSDRYCCRYGSLSGIVTSQINSQGISRVGIAGHRTCSGGQAGAFGD